MHRGFHDDFAAFDFLDATANFQLDINRRGLEVVDMQRSGHKAEGGQRVYVSTFLLVHGRSRSNWAERETAALRSQ